MIMMTANITHALPTLNQLPNGAAYIVVYVAFHVIVIAALFTLAHDLADAFRFAGLTSSKMSRAMFGRDSESVRAKYVYRSALVLSFYLAIPLLAWNGLYAAYGRTDISPTEFGMFAGLSLISAMKLVFRPVKHGVEYVRWLEAELLAQNQTACIMSQTPEPMARPQIVAPSPAMALTLRRAAAGMMAAGAGSGTSPI